MESCQNINFSNEEDMCAEAFKHMDLNSWMISTHYFIQEEKECIENDGNIKTYISCSRFDFGSS